MNVHLVLPILIPLVTGAAAMLAGGSRVVRRGISIFGATALLAASFWLLAVVRQEGIQVVQLGDWPAPFGITLVADLFSAVMVVVAAFVGFCVAIYSLSDVDSRRERYGFHSLYHALLMGVCGAFLTGDLFNLFVWFEVMLMASFVLVALGGERRQIEGGVKYLTLNFLASGFFLTALGLLYGKAGTLNMADLAVKLSGESLVSAMPTALLLLVAFGIKAGVFPLFFWLPASYHTPPPAVSAVFAGLLTKVGVYALIRVFTLIFQDPVLAQTVVIVSVLTMVCGVLGAAAQMEMRRVLSFHIISQIGYMILGLGLLTVASIGAAIFYTVHHIIVKTNLFLISGIVARLGGTGELKQLGGLYRDHPGIAFLFMIPAMSLAGVPPLSGFFAKFTLIKSAFEVESWWPAAAALAVGLLTMFSMIKIWNEVFWKPRPEDAPVPAQARTPMLMVLPAVLMACVTIAIGVFPGALLDIATGAAEQLKQPAGYIEAVLRLRAP